MKRVELKVIQNSNTPGDELCYKTMLLAILRMPQDGRVAMLDEIRRTTRILDALEEFPDREGTINLEDADFALLKNRVEKHGYPFNHKIYLQFIDDIVASKTVEKEKKE